MEATSTRKASTRRIKLETVNNTKKQSSEGGAKRPKTAKKTARTSLTNAIKADGAESAEPGVKRTAAGEKVTIPIIGGDGTSEIGKMRGAILRANIAKALEGSYLHMKALFEYASLWPAGAHTEDGDSSLASLLLEKLDAFPGAEGVSRVPGQR